jgi:hypothetical protein
MYSSLEAKIHVMKKILINILLFLILTATSIWLVYTFVYNKAHTDYDKADAAFTGDARQLYEQAMQMGEQPFMEAYKNKAIEISGNISEAGTNSIVLSELIICEIIPNDDFEIDIGMVLTCKGRLVGLEEDLLTGDLLIRMDECRCQP